MAQGLSNLGWLLICIYMIKYAAGCSRGWLLGSWTQKEWKFVQQQVRRQLDLLSTLLVTVPIYKLSPCGPECPAPSQWVGSASWARTWPCSRPHLEGPGTWSNALLLLSWNSSVWPQAPLIVQLPANSSFTGDDLPCVHPPFSTLAFVREQRINLLYKYVYWLKLCLSFSKMDNLLLFMPCLKK